MMLMEKTIGSKTYELSKELEDLAEKVYEKEAANLSYTKEDNIKIGYMLVYPNISKTTAGRCLRTGNELKYFSEYDYIISMSGELWDSLDAPTKYILMLHELSHILVLYNKKGEKKHSIKNHDLMDFKSIVKRYGVDWIDTVKLSISSLYDMNPEEEDKIKI